MDEDLDEDLWDAIAAERRRTGVAEAEMIRRAVVLYLAFVAGERGPEGVSARGGPRITRAQAMTADEIRAALERFRLGSRAARGHYAVRAPVTVLPTDYPVSSAA
jgi:hypothetical protein